MCMSCSQDTGGGIGFTRLLLVFLQHGGSGNKRPSGYYVPRRCGATLPEVQGPTRTAESRSYHY